MYLNVDLNNSTEGFIIHWLWKLFSPCKQLLSEGCKGYTSSLHTTANNELLQCCQGWVLVFKQKCSFQIQQRKLKWSTSFFFSSMRMNLKITLVKIYSVLLRFNGNCKSCKQNPVEANSTCSGSTIHSDWNPPHGELFTVFG